MHGDARYQVILPKKSCPLIRTLYVKFSTSRDALETYLYAIKYMFCFSSKHGSSSFDGVRLKKKEAGISLKLSGSRNRNLSFPFLYSRPPYTQKKETEMWGLLFLFCGQTDFSRFLSNLPIDEKMLPFEKRKKNLFRF